MSDVICPHCRDAYIDCSSDELHCWKCGFSLTKEELKSKEALNMRKELTEKQIVELKMLSDGGMKQKEIAAKVGISSSSVCKYLKGSPVKQRLPYASFSEPIHKPIGLGGIEDEIIKRKVIIDKLLEEVNVLERALGIMGGP